MLKTCLYESRKNNLKLNGIFKMMNLCRINKFILIKLQNNSLILHWLYYRLLNFGLIINLRLFRCFKLKNKCLLNKVRIFTH